MTRINLIDPVYLLDKHLGAEYRELPRIFGLVRKAQLKGLGPQDLQIPNHYVLGKGHVRFFFNKLAWLKYRQLALVNECFARGRRVNFNNIDALLEGLDRCWLGHWSPSRKEILINLTRLNERGGLRRSEANATEAS